VEVKIFKGTALIKPDVVDEVIVTLPGAAVVFDVISEGCTLDELVINFTVSKFRIISLEI